MKTRLTKFAWPALLGSALILTGCGGGGGGNNSRDVDYTGITTPAAVTSTNAEELSTTATEAVAHAVVASANPLGVVLSGTANNTAALPQAIVDITRRIQATLPSANLPVGITESGTDTSDQLNEEFGGSYFCGGSITWSDTWSETSEDSSGTTTFNNLCANLDMLGMGTGQMYLNGKMSYTDTATQWSETYTNFSVTIHGETYTYNGTTTCSSVSPYDCTNSMTYTGSNGPTYKMEDVDISGDNVSGYDVNATFYNPTYGSVTVSATGITFGCSNGYPNEGTITITGTSGSTATITFRSDCTGFDGSWADGKGGTGDFSYSWPPA